MGKQHITLTASGVLIALLLTASARGEPQISLPEAEAALEAAKGPAVVRACRADAFIRVGTDRVQSVAYFTLRCDESTDNWTANVNLSTGLTTWMPCAMFRMLAPDVGARCLNKLQEWE